MAKQNLKPETYELLDITFERVWKEEVKDFTDGLKRKEDSRLELKQKIKGLAEIIADKNKSPTLREACEQQIEEFAPLLKEMEKSEPKKTDLETPYQTALGKAATFLKSPYEYWESVDVLEKQRMFFFFFDEKLPYSKDEGYRTDRIPSAARLFNEFVSTNSYYVEMGGSEPPCKQ